MYIIYIYIYVYIYVSIIFGQPPLFSLLKMGPESRTSSSLGKSHDKNQQKSANKSARNQQKSPHISQQITQNQQNIYIYTHIYISIYHLRISQQYQQWFLNIHEKSPFLPPTPQPTMPPQTSWCLPSPTAPSCAERLQRHPRSPAPPWPCEGLAVHPKKTAMVNRS